MLQILHFLLALIAIAVLALLASHDRKNIKPRYIFQLLIIETALAYFFYIRKVG